MADVYLPASRSEKAAAYAATLDDRRAATGIYRHVDVGLVRTVALGDPQGLKIEGGPELKPVAARTYSVGGADRWVFDGAGKLTVTDEYGTVDRFERIAIVKPTADQLRAFAGTYSSHDADVELTAKVEGERLVLWRRPATTIALTPLYTDAFRAPSLGTAIFRRDANGRVVEFSVVQDRVWNMPFRRIVPASSNQRE